MADPVQAYNGTGMTGGDPMKINVNMWYDAGDIAWMITSTALVLLMIPGVGFFYSGLARRKSALSLIWLSVMSTAVISFQWFFWGYSLTFSHTAGLFIGNFENFGFRNVLAEPSVGSAKIPDLLFAVYQGMFAAITVALAVGAVAERGRMLPCVIFMFVWSTLIYDPIACWTWNSSGWVNKWGGLDFAGGTPVHISSGTAALAYSYMLGPRHALGSPSTNFAAHDVTHVVIGTVFLWVGWFGFNAGSANAANLRAVMAAVVTNLAACVGGITWCLVDYCYERKWTTVGFCSGVVTGLVAITPGSGYVPPWSAVVFGVVGAVAANFGTKLKYWVRIDDSLDIFAVHAVGGLIGNVCTGLFASDSVVHLDGFSHIKGGFVDGHWLQLAIQLGDSFSGGVYSFVGSIIILSVINSIPGCKLRAGEFEEYMGIDACEIGEYAHDYVEVTRNVGDKTDARSLEFCVDMFKNQIDENGNPWPVKRSTSPQQEDEKLDIPRKFSPSGSDHSKDGSAHSKGGSANSKGGSANSKDGSTHSDDGSANSKGGSASSKSGSTHSDDGPSHFQGSSSRNARAYSPDHREGLAYTENMV